MTMTKFSDELFLFTAVGSFVLIKTNRLGLGGKSATT
jgi:hypothetical protein